MAANYGRKSFLATASTVTITFSLTVDIGSGTAYTTFHGDSAEGAIDLAGTAFNAVISLNNFYRVGGAGKDFPGTDLQA
jgi:hypothetical protein